MFLLFSIKNNLKAVFTFMAAAFIFCFIGCNRALADTQKPPIKIGISYNKTTNLIFPFAIKSVDRGSRGVIAQIAAGADNILQIKAAGQNFAETNLTVITTGGYLYSFIINYNYHPHQLNFILSKEDCIDPLGLRPNAIAHPTIEANAKIAEVKKSNLRIGERKDGMLFSLTGLYVKNNIFYFRLVVKNNSPIDYNTSQMRFFTCDKKKMRRTASQQLELLPFLDSNTNTTV